MIYKVTSGYDCYGKRKTEYESIYVPSWFTKTDELRFVEDLNRRYNKKFIYEELNI